MSKILKFPLDKYDESGRLKPPLFFYFGLIYLCRSVFFLIVALSLRGQSDALMAVFYPSHREFYLSLVIAAFAMYLLFIVSRRYSLWHSHQYLHFRLLLPFTFFTVAMDICLQIYILYLQSFAFAANKVMTLTFAFAFIAYLLTNPLIRSLSEDWRKQH